MIQPLELKTDHRLQPAGNPLQHISASTVKLYLTCPLKFRFKKVLLLSEPVSPALHLGKAVHAALQCFHKARWRGLPHDRDTVQNAFSEAYNTPEEVAAYPDAAAKAANHDKGVQLVDAYLDSGHGQMADTPLGVEVQLEERFYKIPLPVLGYIDLVRTGNVPVDYKTCASSPNLELEAFQHELQLTLYQMLIEAATGDAVTGRELVFLVKTKTPRVIVHRLPPAAPQQKQRALDITAAAVDGIDSERFYPQPGMHCSWCSFRAECARWTGGAR